MWPFSYLRKRRYQRAFDAALLVLLAAHTFSRLSTPDQSRVDRQVDEILKKTVVPPAAHRRWAPPDVRALYRAEAMVTRGIEPAIAGYSWNHLMRHWRLMPETVWLDYHPYAKPTFDAEAELESKGVVIANELRSKRVAV